MMAHKKFYFSSVLSFVLFLSVFVNCYAQDPKEKESELDFLVITDMHVDTANKDKQTMEFEPNKQYGGSPRKNDSDIDTFQRMLNAIKNDIDNNEQSPEFILVLGDFAGHDRVPDPDTGKTSIPRDIRTGYKMMYDAFSETPMFYVFGNNDGLGAKDGRFHYDNPDFSGEDNSPHEIAVYRKTGWSNGFLSTGLFCDSTKKARYPCLVKDSVNYIDGYYAAYVRPKLKLIAMNTVMLSFMGSKKVTEADARAQIEWFKLQLASVRSKGEFVIVAVHNPIGDSSSEGRGGTPYNYLKPAYHKELSELIRLYDKEIVTVLAGHTHWDEVKVLVDPMGRVVGDLIITTPAMSSAEGNSPGLKYFYLNREQGRGWILEDYQAFRFVRIEQRIGSGKYSVLLEPVYRFKSKYCVGKSFSELEDCIDTDKLQAQVNLDYTAGNPNIDMDIKYPGALFIPVENSGVVEDLIPGNVFNQLNYLYSKRLLHFSSNKPVIPWLHLKMYR